MIDNHIKKANRYRIWAGGAKWTGIGITAVMMVIAGLSGRIVASDLGQKPEELASLLRDETGKRRKLAVSVGFLSACVAAATMIGSQLELEQASQRERAKDMHSLYHTARAKLDSDTLSEVRDALKMLGDIRIK